VRVTAYAIVQRVPAAPPRLRSTRGDVRLETAASVAPPLPLEARALPRLEADDPESLADRVVAIRTALGQTTGYLFSPEAWR
jgi:hypothetical protein